MIPALGEAEVKFPEGDMWKVGYSVDIELYNCLSQILLAAAEYMENTGEMATPTSIIYRIPSELLI